MKKLTAGIFATILGLTTVNAFAANQSGVASTQYVRGAMDAAVTTANTYTDTKIGTVNTSLGDYVKNADFTQFQTTNTAAINKAASDAQAAAISEAATAAARLYATNEALGTVETTANAASGNALQALSKAENAVTSATDALTAANAAKSDAATAKSDAATAVSTAEGAAGVANTAMTTANDASGVATKASEDVATLTTTVNGNTTAISNLQTASATHATKAEVKAVDDKLADYVLLKDVVDEYKPAN